MYRLNKEKNLKTFLYSLGMSKEYNYKKFEKSLKQKICSVMKKYIRGKPVEILKIQVE